MERETAREIGREIAKGISESLSRGNYPFPGLLSNNDMMEIFGATKGLIRSWRDKGLPYIKVGIRYFYIEANVLEWLKAVEVRNS